MQAAGQQQQPPPPRLPAEQQPLQPGGQRQRLPPMQNPAGGGGGGGGGDGDGFKPFSLEQTSQALGGGGGGAGGRGQRLPPGDGGSLWPNQPGYPRSAPAPAATGRGTGTDGRRPTQSYDPYRSTRGGGGGYDSQYAYDGSLAMSSEMEYCCWFVWIVGLVAMIGWGIACSTTPDIVVDCPYDAGIAMLSIGIICLVLTSIAMLHRSRWQPYTEAYAWFLLLGGLTVMFICGCACVDDDTRFEHCDEGGGITMIVFSLLGYLTTISYLYQQEKYAEYREMISNWGIVLGVVGAGVMFICGCVCANNGTAFERCDEPGGVVMIIAGVLLAIAIWYYIYTATRFSESKEATQAFGLFASALGVMIMFLAGAICTSGDGDCSEGGGIAMLVLSILGGAYLIYTCQRVFPDHKDHFIILSYALLGIAFVIMMISGGVCTTNVLDKCNETGGIMILISGIVMFYAMLWQISRQYPKQAPAMRLVGWLVCCTGAVALMLLGALSRAACEDDSMHVPCRSGGGIAMIVVGFLIFVAAVAWAHHTQLLAANRITLKITFWLSVLAIVILFMICGGMCIGTPPGQTMIHSGPCRTDGTRTGVILVFTGLILLSGSVIFLLKTNHLHDVLDKYYPRYKDENELQRIWHVYKWHITIATTIMIVVIVFISLLITLLAHPNDDAPPDDVFQDVRDQYTNGGGGGGGGGGGNGTLTGTGTGGILDFLPSCTNGIRDGNEVGIDCGGVCLASCIQPSPSAAPPPTTSLTTPPSPSAASLSLSSSLLPDGGGGGGGGVVVNPNTVFCRTYPCPATHHIRLTAVDRQCLNNIGVIVLCTRDDCCDPNPYCQSYPCPFQGLERIPGRDLTTTPDIVDDDTLRCREAVCSVEDCCQAISTPPTPTPVGTDGG